VKAEGQDGNESAAKVASPSTKHDQARSPREQSPQSKTKRRQENTHSSEPGIEMAAEQRQEEAGGEDVDKI